VKSLKISTKQSTNNGIGQSIESPTLNKDKKLMIKEPEANPCIDMLCKKLEDRNYQL